MDEHPPLTSRSLRDVIHLLHQGPHICFTNTFTNTFTNAFSNTFNHTFGNAEPCIICTLA